MRQVLFVFETNVIQQVGIQLQDLVHLDGPGLGVRLGIVHGELDFQASVIETPDALGHLGGIRDRVAAGIEPDPVAKAGGLHHQSVAFPLRRSNSRSRKAEDRPGSAGRR